MNRMHPNEIARQIAELAAHQLSVPPHSLPVDLPLSGYGLDSMGVAELTVALEDWAGRKLPEGLLYERPSVRELVDYFVGADSAQTNQLEIMREDSRLSDAIHPEGADMQSPPRTILLTGATGFVGTRTLDALLRRTGAQIVCLVRCADPADARSRLHDAGRRFGLPGALDDARIEIAPGDLAAPGLGLAPIQCAELARRADAICHCAADVNWVAGYSALRVVNVLAVEELLRLACAHHAKPFLFLSSLAACYSTEAPCEVPEDAEVIRWLPGLHLGYAQTKCVAETLVREAGRRGLPVTILRPALIAGDSRSGCGNTADFLSLFLKGCIQLGCAPDLEWLMDFCPVDHIAELLVELTDVPAPGTRTLHLLNPRKRHWREGVLWMNLSGYPVRLVPYEDWLKECEAAQKQPDFALRTLRRFFADRPAGAGGLTIPQLSEEHRRAQAGVTGTRQVLAGFSSAPCHPLNGRLLDRYFAAFVADGFLPAAKGRDFSPMPPPGELLPPEFFHTAAGAAAGNEIRCVRGVECAGEGADNSIMTEMTAWGSRRLRGLFRQRIEFDDERGTASTCEVMVKLKPSDREVLRVGRMVAGLCDAALGEAFGRFEHRLEFNGCHLRELALYQQGDERVRRHLPACYGVWRDDERRIWALALECLDDLVLMDSVDRPEEWREPVIAAAIRGLASLQAVWMDRHDELRDQPWAAPEPDAAEVLEMTPLWTGLAEQSRTSFGEETREIQQTLIATLGDWWPRLREHQCTLIHNDFNPRNLAFRRGPAGLSLCAYDWELAAWGAPQRDLAELLCFVQGPDTTEDETLHWLEFHRTCLADASGRRFAKPEWREGFRLSLHAFMLERLPFYSLVNHFREQRFLRRVVANWRRLVHQ